MEYRGYKISTDSGTLMKKIEPIGRGSVHLSLRGYFTTIKDTKRTIDRYEDGKEE